MNRQSTSEDMMSTDRVGPVALAALLWGTVLLSACASEPPLDEVARALERHAALEGNGDAKADGHQDLVVRNRAGMQLMVDEENTQPALRIVLPGHPTSDRSIEVLFPEHVTVREHGATDARQLYLFRPGQSGERPQWRRSERSLEYERDFPGGVHMLARATLEEDGVRFRFKPRNQSDRAYDLILAVLDPRLTGELHDERLERTYVHHADGFDLLASETPARLTMPLDRWLPARYLASFTWPVPPQRVEDRGGITYYNKSRAVDAPFIATLSRDRHWVVASFTRTTGNVWSNPELTCQHVDPEGALSPSGEATLNTKMLVVRGSLDEVFAMAMRQRDSLEK
ncbi:MAG: hypothetical protein DMD35_04655 [Gemmatimonadetes bacterium]|nr:MAG: hypothetical protein DMD35_04655 [Gemmatimonadota bacterium]